MSELKIIARIKSDFPTKFGIPRQSGLIDSLKATIIFEPEYRIPEAIRGLEEYSHLWLIWGFHQAEREGWSPTVRPPRLGGNVRMGVFATRSPFRPNPIGLSSVKLDSIDKENMILHISGADLMDGTPIYDIKPYLSYVDSHPEAIDGFAGAVPKPTLNVEFSQDLLSQIPSEKREPLLEILTQDPRPAYQNDPERIYGFLFAGYEIKFKVSDHSLIVIHLQKKTL